MNIILYLLQLIQYLYQQNCWLLNFICRYIPLRQWAFDDSHSPKYQKFKTDELPVIKTFIKQDWQFLLKYYEWKYHKFLKPVQRRNGRIYAVLSVVRLITTYMTTMGITVSISAKSVVRHSLPGNTPQPHCVSSVRTVATVLLLLKTDPFSAYTNV